MQMHKTLLNNAHTHSHCKRECVRERERERDTEYINKKKHQQLQKQRRTNLPQHRKNYTIFSIIFWINGIFVAFFLGNQFQPIADSNRIHRIWEIQHWNLFCCHIHSLICLFFSPHFFTVHNFPEQNTFTHIHAHDFNRYRSFILYF